MNAFLKIFLPLVSLAFLASCGFHPLYGVRQGSDSNVGAALESVSIEGIPDREGQYLHNALMNRLYRHGRPDSPRYILNIDKIEENKTDLDITKNADATRGQLRLHTTMHLVDSASRKTVLEQHLQTVSSYNILSSEFTNRVSEQNTRENALNELARQVEQALALYFKKNQ